MVSHDLDDLPAHAKPGTVLQRKYRIDAVLGVGGMGAVVQAQHLVLDETVAIKVLLPALAANQEAAARFIREAKAALRIKSDHVVRVLDVDQLPDGTPYMVMEYLHGNDLDAALAKSGPLAMESAVDAIIQACAALCEAHSKGIVHRDIKPANLFEAEDGRGGTVVKVLDFGISKLTEPGEQGMTKTSAVMGSALYMSPEQLSSAKNVDARCDIYSLGVSLFELLSGRFPFEGETMPQLVAAVLAGIRHDLSGFRPDLPVELVQVIHRALAGSPDERQSTAGELAAALAPFASARGAAIAQTLVTATPAQARSSHMDVAGAAAPRVNIAATVSNTTNATAPLVHDATIGAPKKARATWPYLAAVAAVLVAVVVMLWLGSPVPATTVPVAAPEDSAVEPGGERATGATGVPHGEATNTGASATADASVAPAPSASATALTSAPAPTGLAKPGKVGRPRQPPPSHTTSPPPSKDYGGRK